MASEIIVICRRWDPEQEVYISVKTNIETRDHFENAFPGRLHNNGKYEYRLIENGRRVAYLKSNDRL